MTSSVHKWIVAGALAAFAGGDTLADTMTLTGTVRDFPDYHSDFEDTYNGKYPLIQGMVKDELGPDNKPVLNLTPGGAIAVEVVSHDKELSNVVLRLAHVDDAMDEDLDYETVDDVHYKYDGLSGHEGTFEVPDDYPDYRIIGLWVKAGPNSSGDGPGYGEEIEGEYVEYEDVGPVGADSGDFSVSFIAVNGVPRQWRIESEQTFNQWHRTIDGVNMAVPYEITLDNGLDRPGGTYTYERSKHNNKPFFPIDGELFGNEDRSHNYHFTFEIATTFVFTHPDDRNNESMFLRFSGDDDVWVFINGQLVVDLGGVHQEVWDEVNLDDEMDRLGLEYGEEATFHFFYAERHTTEANLTLETNIPFQPLTYD